MPEKISNSDLFDSDFLQPQKKAFEEIITLIKSMETEMTDVLKVQEKLLKGGDKASVEGLNKRKKAVETVNKVEKELINLEKQRIGVEEKAKISSQKVSQQLQKTAQEKLKTKQQELKLDKEILNAEKALNAAIKAEKSAIEQGLKVKEQEVKIKERKFNLAVKEKKELKRLDTIKQKEIATAKKVAAVTEKENSEYFKQSRTLNNLRKKYKDLILVQGKESQATRRMLKDIRKLDKNLKKVDASVGQFQRSVGNYGKAFGKVSGVLRNMGLAVGGLAIIRNITGIVRNFEQSQADLASVLGVNVEEMKALTDQARELGATTRFTAGEVAGLQKEFAKLGFDQTEIKNMTEATLQLAAATGTDLARAAEVTGSTLRGFGLSSVETQRVVDVMAKSFSSSSLDMEKFATAMSSVAPVAKTAGLSVEKTTALLGTLTDRGLDASTAGTGLRNIFLELSKRGLSFEEAMLQINSATDKNAASLELFGKRGATVGTILSETSEDVATLEAKLNDAGGAAEEMADKQLNTLNGQLDLLKSAWEGFILDLEEGTGVFAGLKDVIGFVARNLKTIIKVITVATVAWAANKAVIASTTLIKRASAAASALFRTAKIAETAAVEGSTVATKALNVAMKANPIGLLITLIAAAVTAYALFADTTTDAEKAQRRFNEAAKEGAEIEKEVVKVSNERLGKALKEAEREARKEGLTVDELRKKKLEAAYEERQNVSNRIEDIKKERVDGGALAFEQLKNAKAIQKQHEIEASQRKGRLTGVSSFQAEDKKRIQSAKNRIDDISGLTAAQLKEEREQLRSLGDFIEELNVEVVEDERNKNEELAAERKKARADRRKELMLLNRMLEDLDNEAIINEEERQIETLKTKSRREIEAIKGNSQIEKDLRNELKLKELREIADIEDEFAQQRAAAAFETVQVIGKIEKEQINQQVKEREEAIDKEFALLLDQLNRTGELQGFEIDRLKGLINEKYDLLVRALEDERDLILLNEDLTAEERELINIQFNNKLGNLNKKRETDLDAMYDTLGNATDVFHASQEAKEKEAADKQKALLKQRLDALKEFAAKAVEIANAKTDQEIANIDKELEASKSREDQLQELAAKGNLTAEQSVGAEIKRQADLERQKEELEKKKARRQLVLQGLELLSSNIDSGKNNPVASTIADMTILLSALSALPGFIDGTETTVGAALGKPQLNTGTDDYVVRVDGQEKILNPKLSKRTGNATTEEIVRGYEMASSGAFDENIFIRPQMAALNQPFQNNQEVLKKFDSLEASIRNKPILSDFKFDELTKALIVTVEQNGDLRRKHYKLKD